MRSLSLRAAPIPVACRMIGRVIHPSVGLPLLHFLALLPGVFIVLVELRVLAYAYHKIGVQPRYALALMILTLLDSHVNISLYAAGAADGPATDRAGLRAHVCGPWRDPGRRDGRRGERRGCTHSGAPLPLPPCPDPHVGRLLIGIGVIALGANRLAYVVSRFGIVVPMFIPPLVAAGTALLLAFRRAPPLAYVSGSMGR